MCAGRAPTRCSICDHDMSTGATWCLPGTLHSERMVLKLPLTVKRVLATRAMAHRTVPQRQPPDGGDLISAAGQHCAKCDRRPTSHQAVDLGVPVSRGEPRSRSGGGIGGARTSGPCGSRSTCVGLAVQPPWGDSYGNPPISRKLIRHRWPLKPGGLSPECSTPRWAFLASTRVLAACSADSWDLQMPDPRR